MSQQSLRQAARRSALDAQPVLRNNAQIGNASWRGWQSKC
jgi:hypothetical protein